MPPRVAIPLPHSTDRDYSERAIPQYERAVEMAGGEAVRVPLDITPEELAGIADSCHAVVLPGSNADVDPARFGAERSPHTAAADRRREAVDDFLLKNAYQRRKPVLGICYGLQSLNVHLAGSLIQHIRDSLPEETRAKVNHEAGKTIAIAHTVEIEPASILASIVRLDGYGLTSKVHCPLPVNSSHHQSAGAIGKGLRVVARCPDDGIIEALEGTASDHFVLAVQWHPERSVDQDEPSRAIFRAVVEATERNRT